jgi:hypothetical protein
MTVNQVIASGAVKNKKAPHGRLREFWRASTSYLLVSPLAGCIRRLPPLLASKPLPDTGVSSTIICFPRHLSVVAAPDPEPSL